MEPLEAWLDGTLGNLMVSGSPAHGRDGIWVGFGVRSTQSDCDSSVADILSYWSELAV